MMLDYRHTSEWDDRRRIYEYFRGRGSTCYEVRHAHVQEHKSNERWTTPIDNTYSRV